jgi:hypothetical protein
LGKNLDIKIKYILNEENKEENKENKEENKEEK